VEWGVVGHSTLANKDKAHASIMSGGGWEGLCEDGGEVVCVSENKKTNIPVRSAAMDIP
jgi:hypothetical protein